MSATPDAPEPTIYEWAGGRSAFERWLRASRSRDDLVERGDGCPNTYTTAHGGYEHMLAKHRGLAITSEQECPAGQSKPDRRSAFTRRSPAA